MKRILVTGAGGSAAYNFIESLRNNPCREEFYIVGTDASPYHLELSRVDKRYLVPKIDDPGYLSKLNRIISEEKIDFLHVQPDVEVDFLSKHRNEIGTKMFLPNKRTIEICQDKMELNRILKEQGIAVPETAHITSEEELENVFVDMRKRHEKMWLRAIRGAGSRAALPVKKLNQAKMWIDYWQEMKGVGYGDFMLSEFLPGKEYAFQSFWMDGEILMSQARERLEYVFGNITPSGQTSTPSVARTVHNDEVNNLVFKAVRAIDPHASGIFCADLKTDKFGIVRLTEINAGRFFTTSFFFSSAGANMPYYYTKAGLGEQISCDLKPFDCVPPDCYWVRMIDMGYKLIKPDEWTSKEI